jgi:hypothetical protein
VKQGRAVFVPARDRLRWPDRSADDGLDHGFAVFDDDVEVDFAVFVLLAELGFGRADRLGQAFVADVGLFGLLLGLLKARMQVA